MKKPTPAKKAYPARRAEPNQGWAETAAKVSDALHDVICALGSGLEFNQKRDVLSWAAEAHGIDPGKLQGRENPK